MSGATDDPVELVRELRGGDRRALARGLSWVENRDSRSDAVLSQLTEERDGSPSFRLGITGAPGVGKSSYIARLIPLLRAEERTVAVLAVDPTSPVTGGALLGDRVRMTHHGDDTGVYIRSVASRTGAGGLSGCTDEAAELLDHAGFDCVIIETVGTGQLELGIADEADHVQLLVSPESGDTMQFLKSGTMEIVDEVVVNKADRDGADAVLARASELAEDRGLPAPLSVSSKTGEGFDAVTARVVEGIAAASDAAESLDRTKCRIARRLRRRAEEAWLRGGWGRVGGKSVTDELAAKVLAGEVSFSQACRKLEAATAPEVDDHNGQTQRNTNRKTP